MEPWSLFPGVYTQLADTSFAVAGSAGTTGFIVFMSERGPDNQLTLNSRVDELLTTYGNVDITSYGQGLKIAIQYLRYSTSLYTIRVTPDESNLSCMKTVYKNFYGTFNKSQIEIREAAYANIGIGTNEEGEFELVHAGPEDLGTIISTKTLTPPTNPNIGDRYYLPMKDPNTGKTVQLEGAWNYYTAEEIAKGETHAGTVAICISNTAAENKRWIYKKIRDTSVATIAGQKVVAAKTYDSVDVDSTGMWRDYENVYMEDGTYANVLDITDTLPLDPEDGDAYLISLNTEDPSLINALADANGTYHIMKVMQYQEDIDEWVPYIYNKVFIEREYILDDGTLASDPSVEVGDRFVVSLDQLPERTEGATDSEYLDAIEDYLTENNLSIPSEWYKKNNSLLRHDDEIAEKTATGWKFYTFDVAGPDDIDKFQSLVISIPIQEDIEEDENDSLATIKLNENKVRRIEYKKKEVFISDVIWTTDTNADFCAYAHRANQFQDVVENASPDSSKTNGTIEPFVFLYPIGRGSYYNGVYVDFKLSAKSEHEESDFEKTLIMDIYNTTDGNILKVESFEVSFNPNKKDIQDNSIFIEDVLDTYSNYLRCAINRDIFTKEAKFTQNIHSDIATLFARYAIRNRKGNTSLPPSLLHGDDGNIWDSNGNLNWDVAQKILVKAYTGTLVNPASKDQNNPYETGVLDRESVLIDLVFDAGYPRPVKVAIQTLIEARHQDCFGIIDLGDNASAKAAYEARTVEGGVGTGFNSQYIAIYEPYSLVYDEFSGRRIWISPVYHAARAFGLTDLNYGMHHAPAGVNRGLCPEIERLRYNLGKETAYQDKFVSYNINPIIQNRDGYVIWGQSTSYLKSSKYQDINVVRIVLRIKRDLEFALRQYIEDINDDATWNLMGSTIDSYLGDLISQQAITSYTAEVYASEYDISKHRVRVDVMIQPKQVIYQILLTISV